MASLDATTGKTPEQCAKHVHQRRHESLPDFLRFLSNRFHTPATILFSIIGLPVVFPRVVRTSVKSDIQEVPSAGGGLRQLLDTAKSPAS